jgi:hypothetical protein
MNMKYMPHKEIRDRNIKFQPTVTGVHGNPTNGDETSNCYKTQALMNRQDTELEKAG